MRVTIKSNGNNHSVEWRGNDGYMRGRKRRSMRAAHIFARQLACRLEIDAYKRDLKRLKNQPRPTQGPKGDC